MNFKTRLLIYALLALPIPILSGIYFGFNWEVYSAWIGLGIIFTTIEISQRWNKQ